MDEPEASATPDATPNAVSDAVSATPDAVSATPDAVSAETAAVSAVSDALSAVADAVSAVSDAASDAVSDTVSETVTAADATDTLDLDALAQLTERPDEDVRQSALARLAEAALPAAGLGKIEELAAWLAAAQGASPTRPITRPRVVLFAGDHGVASAGVSAYAPDATAAQVRQIEDGGGAANTLARLHGASVRVVNVSVGKPSGRIDVEDAATRQDTETAFRLGMEIADAEIDAGADLLIPSLLGVGHTTVASALAGVLTGKDAAAVTGRGSGIDDATWMRKCAAVRDAMRRGRPMLGDQMKLLSAIGGLDFAAACGFLLQAANRKTAVVLDGVGITTCAMLVQRISYRAPQWWLAGAASPEPAHKAALERMTVEALLPECQVRVGEGVAGLLALPLVVSAAALLAELQTFEESGIPAPLMRSRI